MLAYLLVFLNHHLKLICLGFYIIVRNYNIKGHVNFLGIF